MACPRAFRVQLNIVRVSERAKNPHQDLDVGGVTIAIQHPLAMLWKASAHKAFQMLMRRAQAEGDFTLLLYSDGISPQDGLSKHDKRKVVAMYRSILEFDDALYEETVWFCSSPSFFSSADARKSSASNGSAFRSNARKRSAACKGNARKGNVCKGNAMKGHWLASAMPAKAMPAQAAITLYFIR